MKAGIVIVAMIVVALFVIPVLMFNKPGRDKKE
jgi:hypothetical protein